MSRVYIITIFLLLSMVSFGKNTTPKKIAVSDDAYVEAGENSSLNFSEKGDLLLQNPGKQNKYYREVYLKFKLKKVSEISTAVLYLHGRGFPKAGRDGKTVDVAIQRVNNSWNETDITWDNAPKDGVEVGVVDIKQSSKTDWYSVALDAKSIEAAKESGYLSLRLIQNSNSGVGGVIFAKEKAWSDGVAVNKDAYLVINGELPVVETRNISVEQPTTVAPVLNEFKLLVGADVMVKGGSFKDQVFVSEPMAIFGSRGEGVNSEVLLHFQTSLIKAKIERAILYIPLKSPNADVKLSFYDGKGRYINDLTTCWNNRPTTGSHIGELSVSKGDEYCFYELDITSYAKQAHVILSNNITISVLDYAQSGNPVFVGSKEIAGYRSYLKVQTSNPKQVINPVTYSVVKPSYPAVEREPKKMAQWLSDNPIPKKGYWISDLWSQYVEQSGNARLFDFSYAGYRYGEEQIPVQNKILGKITDFGAIPNDGKDDTEAIQRAFDKLSSKKGVILFPKGRYIVNGDPLNPRQLTLNASNIVLRGEGSGEGGTIIHMTNKYLPQKGYGDFVVEVGGEELIYKKHATNITSDSKRGDRVISVKNAEQFSNGDYVKIILYSERADGKYLQDLGRTLTHPLEPEGTWTNFSKYAPYESVNQIKRVVSNSKVELVQPLKKDLLARWVPKMVYAKFYEEVGVENIRFEGEWHGPYQHHGNREMDYGWCALRFNNLANSWVKNVCFQNLTWDMTFRNTKNITATNIMVSGADGHHGVVASYSWDLLVKGMKMEAHRTHNIGGGGMMEGCVFTDIEVVDSEGQIDFHGGGFPMNNLFENIRGVCVAGAGAPQNMPHAGRDNTFYNIVGKQNHSRSSLLVNEFFPEGYWNYSDLKAKRGGVSYDCYKLYPGSIVIGVYKPEGVMEIDQDRKDQDTNFIYVEGLNKANLWPISLYEAQLKLRLND